jgi:Cys-rich protein (TIGR01571 family)
MMASDGDALKPVKEDIPMQPVVVVAQPVGEVPVAHAEPVPGYGVQKGAQPMLEWADDLCNCCSDCSTCCATYWCLPIVTGQLYEKVKGRPGTCGKVAALLFALAIIGAFARSISQNAMKHEVEYGHVGSGRIEYGRIAMKHEVEYGHGWQDHTTPASVMVWGVISSVGGLLSFAGCVITIVLITAVRQAIRSKDQIKPGCCGNADDCCVATFCQCCAVSQMMRHVLSKWMGREPSSYQLCSPTGYVAV